MRIDATVPPFFKVSVASLKSVPYLYIFHIKYIATVPGDADISLPESLPKRPFELMEVYYSLYYMFGFNGTWISDTEIMIRSLINGDVSLYDVTTGESKVIFEDHLLPVS